MRRKEIVTEKETLRNKEAWEKRRKEKSAKKERKKERSLKKDKKGA